MTDENRQDNQQCDNGCLFDINNDRTRSITIKNAIKLFKTLVYTCLLKNSRRERERRRRERVGEILHT